MTKLTERQREWLSEADMKGSILPVYGWGSVAASMVKRGFAMKSFDAINSHRAYKITDAGRAALKEAENDVSL